MLPAEVERCKKSLLHFPAKLEPLTNQFIFEMKVFAQLGKTPCSSSYGDDEVVSRVSVLSGLSGPAHVVRVVPLRIVNSLNAPTTLSNAHVAKKVGEIQPPFTNRYSTRPVPVKILGSRVGASGNHFSPHLVDTGFPALSGMAVLNKWSISKRHDGAFSSLCFGGGDLVAANHRCELFKN